MIKLLKTFALIFALSACSTAGQIKVDNDNWIPYPKEVKRIENLPHVVGEFDCSNKTALLVQFYRNNGLMSYLAFKQTGFTRYDLMLLPTGHMQVAVYNFKFNSWHLIDPTDKNNIDGIKIDYKERRKVNEEIFKRELATARKYLENNL